MLMRSDEIKKLLSKETYTVGNHHGNTYGNNGYFANCRGPASYVLSRVTSGFFEVFPISHLFRTVLQNEST